MRSYSQAAMIRWCLRERIRDVLDCSEAKGDWLRDTAKGKQGRSGEGKAGNECTCHHLEAFASFADRLRLVFLLLHSSCRRSHLTTTAQLDQLPLSPVTGMTVDHGLSSLMSNSTSAALTTDLNDCCGDRLLCCLQQQHGSRGR